MPGDGPQQQGGDDSGDADAEDHKHSGDIDGVHIVHPDDVLAQQAGVALTQKAVAPVGEKGRRLLVHVLYIAPDVHIAGELVQFVDQPLAGVLGNGVDRLGIPAGKGHHDDLLPVGDGAVDVAGHRDAQHGVLALGKLVVDAVDLHGDIVPLVIGDVAADGRLRAGEHGGQGKGGVDQAKGGQSRQDHNQNAPTQGHGVVVGMHKKPSFRERVITGPRG